MGRGKQGRDANGRFEPGCPPGPGRPPRRTETTYLLALARAVSPEDWEAVVRRAVEDAKGGDKESREWLGRYLVGKADRSAPTLVHAAVDDVLDRDEVMEAAERRIASELIFGL